MSKTALVTGGSRGIGFGIAESLAKDGCNVAINGQRDESAVSEALAQLRSHGTEVLYCQGDISDTADRQKILDQIKKKFGQLNVLVNNAGVAPNVRADILEASEESYDRVMRINLKGPYFLTQAVANWMIAEKEKDSAFDACIVNVSSISAIVASPSRGEYCLSKAGMSMSTLLWAVRLGEYDIPVYEVRPGVTKTDMTSAVEEKYNKLIDEGLCVQKRWGYPEDTGKVIAAMVRGDMPYSTGQVVNVDGGLMLHRL